jgi:hypothetical protein
VAATQIVLCCPLVRPAPRVAAEQYAATKGFPVHAPGMGVGVQKRDSQARQTEDQRLSKSYEPP